MSDAKYPLVSVVIPTCNMAKWLPDALHSVLEQTYPNWECIIVDGGSTDETEAVVQSYSSRDKRIRFIQELDEGPAKARNLGIQSSQGDLIAFLDADDQWLPTKLMKQVKTLMDSPEAGLCCAYHEEVDEHLNLLNPWPKVKEMGRYPDEIRPEMLIERNCVPGSASSSVVRRKVFEEIGLFDSLMRRCEDSDMWYRVALKYPIIQEKEVLVRLRKHPNSIDPLAALTGYVSRLKKSREFAPKPHLKLIRDEIYNLNWKILGIYGRRLMIFRGIGLFAKLAFENPFKTMGSVSSELRKYSARNASQKDQNLMV